MIAQNAMKSACRIWPSTFRLLLALQADRTLTLNELWALEMEELCVMLLMTEPRTERTEPKICGVTSMGCSGSGKNHGMALLATWAKKVRMQRTNGKEA
mmetsp:Transcript_38639/g.70514  ORF Transcript_38639/g.70514 Transcript_38639/m.70514 type:complete len:99 (-) Transcript_38639:563-859(-)